MGKCLSKSQKNSVSTHTKDCYIDPDVSITKIVPIRTKCDIPTHIDYRSSRIFDVIYPSDVDMIRSSMSRSRGSSHNISNNIYGSSPTAKWTLKQPNDRNVHTPQKRILGFNTIMPETIS